MAKETRHPFRRRAERPSRRQSGVGARIPSHQLTPSQRLQLEALDALCARLGRTPLREELPPLPADRPGGFLRLPARRVPVPGPGSSVSAGGTGAPAEIVPPEMTNPIGRKDGILMIGMNWLRDPNHVVYGQPEELLPGLSRTLGIPDLAQRVAEFQRNPRPEGAQIKGGKRTTLKIFIPNRLFSRAMDRGEDVWLFTGEMNPAYCLLSPGERAPDKA